MLKKINSYLDKHSYLLSSLLILVALLLDIVAFTGVTIHEGFNYINLFLLIFEITLHVFLIVGLLLKNVRLFNMLMVSVKVFDALYFSYLIAFRLQKLYNGEHIKGVYEYVNFISYTLSAIFLISILIFFILNGITGKHSYWKIMKILICVTIVVMLICSIFEIVSFFKATNFWFSFLEPFYMVFLLSGILIICHYVEKEK